MDTPSTLLGKVSGDAIRTSIASIVSFYMVPMLDPSLQNDVKLLIVVGVSAGLALGQHFLQKSGVWEWLA